MSRRSLEWIDSLAQDLRFGVRTLAKNPAFTGGVLLTLAIGIAGVTAMFSIVYGVLLRPLPYPEPDRLVTIWEDDARYYGRSWPAAAEVRALREETRAFERIGVYREGTHLWAVDDRIEAEYLRSASVDAEILSALDAGILPHLGRGFVADEYRPDPYVAILTHAFWQRRLGADPAILGRTLRLSDGVDPIIVTVVGVLPEDFRFHAITAGGAAVYSWEPHILLPLAPGTRGQLIGRLSAGVSLHAAQAELDRFTAALRQEYPEGEPRRLRAVPLKSEVISNPQSTVLLFFGAVAFVLLIAVVNVANLQLARAAGREAEIAQRLAIGSSPLRLVRMFVTESLILALAGAAAGVILAKIALGWLISGLPSWPRVEQSGIDGHVTAFAVVLAIVIGVLFGLAPASHVYRTNLTRALHEGARGQTEGARPRRLRKMLVASEVALAVVLLAGAGLVGQSLLNLLNEDPGMNPHNLLYGDVRLSRPSASRAEGVQFYESLVRRLEQSPAVASASYSVSAFFGAGPVTVEQAVEPRETLLVYSAVAPDYFQTLGVPIARGRVFDEAAPGEVVIRESIARQIWPGSDPIGQRLVIGTAGPDNPWLTVVGVVPDFKTAPSAPVEAVAGTIALAVYGLCEHAPGRATSRCSNARLVVRTRVDAADVIELVRAEIDALDADARLTSIETSDQLYDSALAAPQFRAALFGIFAAAALLLTFVGVYGVSAYTATRRVREVGVRIVLGASRVDVMRMLLKQACVPVLIGAVLGLLAATAATRLLTAYLYEVEPGDPLIFAAILVTVAATAFVASFMPSFRASVSDPTAALRSD